MKFIKRQGFGTWFSILAIIVSVVGLIIYGAAVSAGTGLTIASGSEPFYDFSRPEDTAMTGAVVTCGILALVFLLLAVVIGQLKFGSIIGTALDLVVGALRIVAPMLLMIAALYFLYGSFSGLGWTFFSNAELAIAPEAVAVGKQVITGLVIFVVSSVAAIVASFFSIRKKNVD